MNTDRTSDERFEVRYINLHGEAVVSRFDSFEAACDDCLRMWSLKRPHAVRDVETDQRWSFRDIQDLRKEAK